MLFPPPSSALSSVSRQFLSLNPVPIYFILAAHYLPLFASDTHFSVAPRFSTILGEGPKNDRTERPATASDRSVWQVVIQVSCGVELTASRLIEEEAQHLGSTVPTVPPTPPGTTPLFGNHASCAAACPPGSSPNEIRDVIAAGLGLRLVCKPALPSFFESWPSVCCTGPISRLF